MYVLVNITCEILNISYDGSHCRKLNYRRVVYKDVLVNDKECLNQPEDSVNVLVFNESNLKLLKGPFHSLHSHLGR